METYYWISCCGWEKWFSEKDDLVGPICGDNGKVDIEPASHRVSWPGSFT